MEYAIPVCYFFGAAFVFYYMFIRKDTGSNTKNRNNANIVSYIIRLLNSTAGGLGGFLYRCSVNRKSGTKEKVLEILYYEKDIQITPYSFLGYKVIIACLLFAAGLFLGNSTLHRLVFAFPCAITGYYLPDIIIRRYSAAMSEEIEGELTYVMDLLRISVLSGQNLYNSFRMISEKYNGRISSSLKNFIRDIDMGTGKDRAYRSLMLASRSIQFRDFINMLMESDKYGSSINDLLLRRSVQLDFENWDNSERKAKKKGMLTLLPLVFLILPAFIMLVGGPLIFSIASDLLL